MSSGVVMVGGMINRVCGVVALMGVMGAEPATRPVQPALPAFQGGGGLLGQGEAVGGPPMKVKWMYKAEEGERGAIEGGAVVWNGAVYVADEKGFLTALELKTGKVKWKYSSGDSFATTPLVLEGKVLLGDLSGVFHAVDAETGKKVWTMDTEGTIHASANASGGKVLFANDSADLFCLNAADGKVVWKGKGGDRINSAPAIGNGLAYFSGCDAQLRGVDVATGQEKFAMELGALAPGSPALVGEKAVVGTDGGKVVCVNVAEQKVAWTYEGVANQMMVYASPSVGEGIVVVGGRDRQVHGIDLQSGQGRWVFKTRGDVDGPALISGGRVYVGSKDKKLYVLELGTGKLLWEFNAGRAITGGPAAAANLLIVADGGGTVFCLEGSGE